MNRTSIKLPISRPGTGVAIERAFPAIEDEGETYVTLETALQWEAMHRSAVARGSSRLPRTRRTLFRHGTSRTSVYSRGTSLFLGRQ